MKMCNVGSVDRALRIIFGVGFLLLGFFAPSMGLAAAWQITFYVIGGIGVITGLVTVCPVYALIGASTCKSKSSAA